MSNFADAFHAVAGNECVVTDAEALWKVAVLAGCDIDFDEARKRWPIGKGKTPH